MHILLTGASGLVGTAVIRAATRRGHRVTGIVGQFPGKLEGLAAQHTLDLVDAPAVQRFVLDQFPEAIVNCAAICSTEQCLSAPSLSYAVNVALPALLGQLAHHLNARFVHLSSEQVFDGTKPPYSVGDAPNPIHLYAKQKLDGERAVADAAPTHAAVVRLPLMLGNSPTGQRSLHERLFADWASGRTPRLYTDEMRQVAHADNVAEMIVELVERNDLNGLYHWAGAELVSRYELGVRIREHFKLTAQVAPLTPVARAETPAVLSQRQASLALNLAPLAGLLKTRPQTLAEQLPELIVPPPWRAWYFTK
ncbi:MAG: SDR family oxidoreductase [Opitutae bacterium]|nr:SDR family oxidoreductase [Opitutae bacterium]